MRPSFILPKNTISNIWPKTRMAIAALAAPALPVRLIPVCLLPIYLPNDP